VDFTGRLVPLAAPAIFAHAFAATNPKAAHRVLRTLVNRAKGGRLYLEIFEEDALAREAADDCGFKYLTTKIAAGSEIKGLYVHGPAPVPIPLPREEEPSLLVLDWSFMPAGVLAAIRDELVRPAPWAQHYSSYNVRKSWTSFALRGYSDDPGFIIKPSEMSQRWKAEHQAEMRAKPRWTPAADAYPNTRDVLDSLGFEFDRVRFMRLASAGGELTRHADITDRDAGLADGRIARLHVPIVTSLAVTFCGWGMRGERIEQQWPAGALCYLDQRKPHAVRNRDPKLDRIHLVIDVVADDRLRAMIRSAMDG
jgi:hypothetical protein